MEKKTDLELKKEKYWLGKALPYVAFVAAFVMIIVFLLILLKIV